MDNLEALIRTMLEEGTSPEDIAKRAGEILNKTSKESTAKNERARILKGLEDRFHKSYADKTLDLQDVAALACLVCAGSYPDWTGENLQEFFELVQRSITINAETVGKNPIEALGHLLSELKDELIEAKQEKEDAGTDRTTKPTKFNAATGCGKIDDMRALKRFIESL